MKVMAVMLKCGGDVDKRTSDNIASLIIRIYSKVSDKSI